MAAYSATTAARAPVRPFDVAITIDDVPWNGAWEGGDTVRALTRGMLATLRRHRAPVAAFVNCRTDRASREVVQEWVAAGATIGNHTTRHLDLHHAAPPLWSKSVRNCNAALRRETGTAIRYFRYPALHQGRTTAQRDAAVRLLRELGYRNAPVTIDNSDYLLVAPYQRAGDARARARIGRLMLEHDSLATEHFRALAPDVAHILLLHANRMTADNLDVLLSMLESMGARFVSLDDAMKDSVYSRPDLYVGPKGFSWLYRISPTVPSAANWDEMEAERLTRVLR